MSDPVVVKNEEAIAASSSSNLVPGLPIGVQRKRMVCSRWRLIIAQFKDNTRGQPTHLFFDLTKDQSDQLHRAFLETREEFSQQSELRSFQTAEVREYVKTARKLVLDLNFFHRKWKLAKYSNKLDSSGRRVAFKQIRNAHRPYAEKLKAVLKMRREINPKDLDEIVFPKTGRYRWAAEYVPDGTKFNWPREVEYRRMIGLFEEWLAAMENQIHNEMVDHLTSLEENES